MDTEIKWVRKIRRSEGCYRETIDLVATYENYYGRNLKATNYLKEIEAVFPIRSRQVATLALVNAWRLSAKED